MNQSSVSSTRTETDSMGPIEVPADAYYGAQTARSLIHFNIGYDVLSDEEHGQIRIEAKEEETGAIVVDVVDNGKGMSSEVAANIFVPFFTTKQDGSGIGLSLSRQIMRLHNGSLVLRSTQPGRTVFRLTFQ